MEKNYAKDTITWQELRAFITGFSKLTLKKLKQYWYIFLLILLTPVALYLTRTYLKEKEYQLQSTLGFQYSHQKLYGQLVVELNYLLESANYDELNKKLGTTTVDWKNIQSIEAKNIFGYRLEEDLGKSEFPFYLIITGKKSDALMPCMEAVIAYLDTHFSIDEKHNLELKLLTDQRDFYRKQVDLIDSLILHSTETQASYHLDESGEHVLISEQGHLLELQEKYIQKITALELDLLNKKTNIHVMSYGIIRQF